MAPFTSVWAERCFPFGKVVFFQFIVLEWNVLWTSLGLANSQHTVAGSQGPHPSYQTNNGGSAEDWMCTSSSRWFKSTETSQQRHSELPNQRLAPRSHGLLNYGRRVCFCCIQVSLVESLWHVEVWNAGFKVCSPWIGAQLVHSQGTVYDTGFHTVRQEGDTGGKDTAWGDGDSLRTGFWNQWEVCHCSLCPLIWPSYQQGHTARGGY